MSGRKLSGAQRRKRKVAFDNEAKKSCHLMEPFLKKGKTDDESHNYTDESDESGNDSEPKPLDQDEEVIDQVEADTAEFILYFDMQRQEQEETAENNYRSIDTAEESNTGGDDEDDDDVGNYGSDNGDEDDDYSEIEPTECFFLVA